MARKYYILCLDPPLEWCALWWAPNACGYAGDLDKAGLYSAAEAKRHATEFDIPVPQDTAWRYVVAHVDRDALRSAMLKAVRPKPRQRRTR